MLNLYSSLEVPVVPCYEEKLFIVKSNNFKDAIGHLHDNVFLLLRPEFISFFLSYLNLLILVSFKKQNP